MGEADIGEQVLPEQFSSLQRFVSKWDRPDTNTRYAERLTSSMTELQEFRDAVLPAIPEIKRHLNAKPLDAFSDAERSLARLAFAWTVASTAVEVHKSQRVRDSNKFWTFTQDHEL